MLYLHDKNMMQNAIKTMYLQDFKTMKKGLKNDTKTPECFLSCVTHSSFNSSKPLHLQPLGNIGHLLWCNRVKSIASSNCYRASHYLNSSLSASSDALDGVSGPSLLNDSPYYIIGIDPGLTGAIAIISFKDFLIPSFIAVYDMPTYSLKVSNKNRKRIDLNALSSLLDLYAGQTKIAIVEDVGQVGTNADPFSSFVFGFATGAVHGALAMAGVKIEKIKPNIWKAAMGLDADKDQSVKRAIKLFPQSAKHLKRKMDHGRAEAILLAWFAFKNLRKS